MRWKALVAHRTASLGKAPPLPRRFSWRIILPRKVVRNGCIHCHQVNEIRRQEAKDAGTWQRYSVWVYPLPENIGVTSTVTAAIACRRW